MPVIHVGFTGTRFGMNLQQCKLVDEILRLLHHLGPLAAHHGDCIGADAQFHELASGHGAWMIGHPPTDESHRAFCDFDEVRGPLSHLARNRTIVTEAFYMIAGPREQTKQPRGGTWYTIGYTERFHKPLALVLPTMDGSAFVSYESAGWPALGPIVMQ